MCLDLAALAVHIDDPPQRLIHGQPRPSPAHVLPVHKEVQLSGLSHETTNRLPLLQERQVVKPLSLVLVSNGGPPEEPVVGGGLEGTGDGAAGNDVVL